MTSLLRTSGLVAVGALLLSLATFAPAHARTASGVCQSASAKQAVSCCSRYIKTKAGKRWAGNGYSCRRSAVRCISDGPVQYCYYPQNGRRLILEGESRDHSQSTRSNSTRP